MSGDSDIGIPITGALPTGRAVVNGAASVSAVPASIPSADWWRGRGIKREWERLSFGTENAGELLRRHFAPEHWGDPIAVYGWEQQTWHSEWDCDSVIRVIIGLYANGRVCDVRRLARSWRTSFYAAQGTQP